MRWNTKDDLSTLLFYIPATDYLVKVLKNTRITPNQTTLFGLFLSIIACILMLTSYHSALTFFIIGISFIITNLMDGVDGELARAKNISSNKGAYLDNTVDRFVNGIIILCACIMLYNLGASYTIFIFGFIFFFGLVMSEVVAISLGDSKGEWQSFREDTTNKLKEIKIFQILGKLHIQPNYLFMLKGNRMMILGFAAMFGYLYWTIILFSIFQTLYWIAIMVFVWRDL